MQIVKKQGQKRDLLAEIDHLEDRCEELEAKQGDIDKLIILKKREVIKMERARMEKEAQPEEK